MSDRVKPIRNAGRDILEWEMAQSGDVSEWQPAGGALRAMVQAIGDVGRVELEGTLFEDTPFKLAILYASKPTEVLPAVPTFIRFKVLEGTDVRVRVKLLRG